jgi:hypothetical protein
LLAGGFLFYKISPVRAQIKDAIAQKIFYASGGRVSVSSISIGLFSAKASGVKIAVNSQSVYMEIDKIKFDFGIIKLPNFSNFNAQDFIESVTMINPKIKIISYLNLQDENHPDMEELLCSQWSKLIVESVPFRTAKIKNGSIEIVARNNVNIVNISGLNGDMVRKDEELNIELSGSTKKLLQKNIFISSRISPIVERQFLSMKFQSANISSPLAGINSYLSFIISGDIDFLFVDKYFPEAINPNGDLSVKNLLISDKNSNIIFSAEADIHASKGTLTTKNIYAKFGKGEAIGFAEMDFNKSGKTIGKIDISVPVNDKNLLVLKNEIHLTDIISPKIFLTTEGSFDRNGVIDTLYGAGRFVDGKVILDSLLLEMRDIAKGEFVGFVAPELNYRFEGNMSIDTKISDKILAQGDAKLLVKGEKFSCLPLIFANISNIKLVQNEREIFLPKLVVNEIGDTLKFTAKDNDFSISGEIKLKDKFPYKANLILGDYKTKEFSEFFGKNFQLKKGKFSTKINGDTSGLNFNSEVLVKTENYGEISAEAAGYINKKRKNVKINSAKWTEDKNSISFKAELNDTLDGWILNFGSENDHIKSNVVFDENIKKIKSGNITIDKFPLNFFSSFIKSKEMEHDLIRTGDISGDISMSGMLDEIVTTGNVKIQNAQIGNAENLGADISFLSSDSTIKFPRFTVKHGDNYLVRTKRLEKSGEKIYINAFVENLKLEDYLSLVGISDIRGSVNAWIEDDGGREINLNVNSDSIFYQELKAQNIKAYFSLSKTEFSLDEFDGEILGIKTNVDFSAAHKNGKVDEAKFNAKLSGDFLSVAGSFKESPVGGNGEGIIHFSGNVSDGSLNITSGRILIPKGQLTVFPFVRGNIENVYADVKIINDDSVSVSVQGTLDKKNIIIRNDYNAGDLTPFQAANLNLGVLRVWTDKGGIPVFLPGFMENRRGNVGWIETAKKGDIPTFTVASHPENLVTLAGTLLLRKAEITFPLLDDVDYPYDFDPFPSLFFDLDIRSADRSVNYFYQLGRENRRRSIRVIECSLDPSGTIGIRGNDADGSFKVVGALRSYNGYMFYGRMFDKNFEIGLDFQPQLLADGTYDNIPIIWGHAETYSDTNRLERIGVKLKTRDEITGELRDRGRFTELVIFPESDDIFNPANKAAADYYSGIYSTVADHALTGGFASQVGDAFMNTYFLNYLGRQFSRRVGLDMFKFETAVMKNSVDFLTVHQLDTNTTRNWNYLVFANSSFTMGKYIFGDEIFLKYQTEFVPHEFTLTPEYKIGVEYQPFPYLWMDFNYGFFRETQTEEFVANPEVRLQLRLPFSDLKNIFKKKQVKSDKDDNILLPGEAAAKITSEF